MGRTSGRETKREHQPASRGHGSGKRNKASLPVVLVVDDIEDNREIYAASLRKAGFAVETAAGGAEAILSAQMHRPAVIVMDLAMPGMDGWDATRRIRSLPGLEGVIILAVSAYVDSVSRRLAYDAGCNDFLVKPCLPAALVERIREALADAKAK